MNECYGYYVSIGNMFLLVCEKEHFLSQTNFLKK